MTIEPASTWKLAQGVRLEYHADALAGDFRMFCDDVRKISNWSGMFARGGISACRVVIDRAQTRDWLASLSLGLGTLCSATAPGSVAGLLYLFMSHGPWQEANRIIEYRKVWGDASLKSIRWPNIERGVEVRIASHQGVRYATTGLLHPTDLQGALEVCFGGSFITFMVMTERVASPSAFTRELFESAFPLAQTNSPPTYIDWGNLISTRTSRKQLLIKPTGYSDDPSRSLDIFGSCDVLRP